MDTLRVWYLWIGILKGHLSVKVSRRTDHFPSNTSAFTGTLSRIYHYPILLSFIRDFPFLDHPPSTIQVLKLSSIDAGSAGSGFEVKLYGFLVGFHGFGSFKYFGCLFYIDMLMWRYQSEVLGLYLAFISHVKIHFLYISCRRRFCTLAFYQKTPPPSCISLAQVQLQRATITIPVHYKTKDPRAPQIFLCYLIVLDQTPERAPDYYYIGGDLHGSIAGSA